MLEHELAHRPQGRLRAWNLVFLSSIVIVALGATVLVWPSVPSALASVCGFSGPIAWGLARWDTARLSARRQRAELHADLRGARRASPGAMIGALLQLAELEHGALREQIDRLAASGRLDAWQREQLAKLRSYRDDPTVVRWREFDANRNGVLELDELAAMLRWMARWPLARLEVFPRTGPLRTHPPMHERILFLLREDPTRRTLEADPSRPASTTDQPAQPAASFASW